MGSPTGFHVFLRVVSSDHIALAMSLVLARLAMPPEEHEFMTAFYLMGEALDRAPRKSHKYQ